METEGEPALQLTRQFAPAQFEGRCPTCGRLILVRNGSGKLWHHGPNNQWRCKGSGGEPVVGTTTPRTRAAFH